MDQTAKKIYEQKKHSLVHRFEKSRVVFLSSSETSDQIARFSGELQSDNKILLSGSKNGKAQWIRFDPDSGTEEQVSESPPCYDMKFYRKFLITLDIGLLHPTLSVRSTDLKVLKRQKLFFPFSAFSRGLYFFDDLVLYLTFAGVMTVDLREGFDLKSEKIVEAADLYQLAIDSDKAMLYALNMTGLIYKSSIKRAPELPKKEECLEKLNRPNFLFYCITFAFEHLFIAGYNCTDHQNTVICLNRSLQFVHATTFNDETSWANHLASFTIGECEFLITAVSNYISLFEFVDRKEIMKLKRCIEIFSAPDCLIYGLLIDRERQLLWAYGASRSLIKLDLQSLL